MKDETQFLMPKKMEDEIEQLIEETKIAFGKAPIKELADQKHLRWNYSICSTRIQPNCDVLIGFNWGAANDTNYDAVNKIPEFTFKQLYDKKDLGSFYRVYNPLKEYLKDDDIDNCVQTNFCFFRSAKEYQIIKRDLELSIPLFRKFIEIISPKKIIGFSGKLRDYFIDNNLLFSHHEKPIRSNNKTLFVSKGIYQIEQKKIPIYFLPHPNAHYTSESRKEAWQFCFSRK